MALLKEKTLSSGYTANYWRILSSEINFDGETRGQLGLYKDETSRRNGCSPIEAISFNYPSVLETRAEIYTEIKKRGIFVDAVDV